MYFLKTVFHGYQQSAGKFESKCCLAIEDKLSEAKDKNNHNRKENKKELKKGKKRYMEGTVSAKSLKSMQP